MKETIKNFILNYDFTVQSCLIINVCETTDFEVLGNFINNNNVSLRFGESELNQIIDN